MELSAHEIGEGLPLLIIHGWETDGRTEELDFEPIFNQNQTPPGLRRIYVDLPGMGTTPANNVKDLDDIYLRLVHFIDARFGKSRFLLAGSSCGGYLARALAQRYADQVDGLLLRVPLIEPKNELRDLDHFQALVPNAEVISNIPAEDKKFLGEDILIQTPAYIQALKTKYEKAYLPASKAADKEVLGPIREDPERYKLSDSVAASDSKHDEKHSTLFAPTLILSGRHDGVVGYRDSLRLLELYPRSTFAVLDRSTHALPVDENENGVFKALVRDWLARVDEWRGLGKI